MGAKHNSTMDKLLEYINKNWEAIKKLLTAIVVVTATALLALRILSPEQFTAVLRALPLFNF